MNVKALRVRLHAPPHPGFDAAGVLAAMPDPVLGEKACCFAVLRPGVAGLTLEELVDYLAERNIAKMKFPERLVVVNEMPLTPTRKIIKSRLKIPDLQGG